jgi:hypothetical protein
MRMHRLACLTTASIAALAGCGRGDKAAEFCYATDNAGVAFDSVRPSPGYVCVSTLVAGRDTVRPDTLMSVGDTVRPDTLMLVRPDTLMLTVVKKELLRRR